MQENASKKPRPAAKRGRRGKREALTTLETVLEDEEADSIAAEKGAKFQ